jgi:hypothetical protein
MDFHQTVVVVQEFSGGGALGGWVRTAFDLHGVAGVG